MRYCLDLDLVRIDDTPERLGSQAATQSLFWADEHSSTHLVPNPAAQPKRVQTVFLPHRFRVCHCTWPLSLTHLITHLLFPNCSPFFKGLSILFIEVPSLSQIVHLLF